MVFESFQLRKTLNIYSYIMGCTVSGSDVIFTTDISYSKTLILRLYNKADVLISEIDLSLYHVNSLVCSVTVVNAKNKICSYEYISDGIAVVDKYMKKSLTIKNWGDFSKGKAAVYSSDFNWEDDINPKYKSSDVISYLLHVRGYSMQDSKISKKHRGTFCAVADKIPYFNELGINQLILMPCYDFNEVISPKKNHTTSNAVVEDSIIELPQINFWGYSDGFYFAPKSSYAIKDEVKEFKEMVKNLHSAGIEIVMQMYFPENYSRKLIADILRYWMQEYHVDGFYLMGIDLPTDIICDDSAFSDIKLYVDLHNTEKIKQYNLYNKCNVSVLDRNFMEDSRRFLKSDEDMLSKFLFHIINNPTDFGVVNYITSNEGFTLNDLVSYDRKHNEDNKEDNRDGNDFNYSWNCGIEGPTKRKSVTALRMRQVKNILAMLLLSQGTPMLLGGDENLNSQNGNNNAYCQDNKIGHVDWKDNKEKNQIREYLKELIQLRNAHPILHMPNQFHLMDDISCGYPDVSYHQDDAYRPCLDVCCRHIAYMLCGKYAKKADGNDDDFFYVSFNMHWENHSFALPKLPKGLHWELVVFTGDDDEKAICLDKLKKNSDFVDVPQRAVAVLKSSNGKIND